MTARAPKSHSIELAGRALPYVVTVSARASRARIRVGPNGVEVVLPRDAPATRAAELLRAQQQWVLRQVARTETLGSLRKEPLGAKPGTVLLGGQPVSVRVVRASTRHKYARVCRDGNELVVHAPEGRKDGAGAAVERWLRQEARRAIESRVAVWSKVMKSAPNRVYVRGQRTKWGNCSKQRNLSLNWRLVMAPQDVLDAIIIHELAHLIEPTHAPRFWLLVKAHCPNYATHDRWLASARASLFAPLAF